MKISVLMSLYHKEKAEYLYEALESVFNQTLRADEVVLVEDGPLTKELYAVVEDFQSRYPELKVIPLPVNGGLAKALNIGVKQCSGDVIARMDTDDICMPTRFEKQVEFLSSHPEIDICGGSLQEFNETLECLIVRHYPKNQKEVLNYIYKASPLAHPTVMIRRKIFDAGLKYNENCGANEDIALWFDVICAGYKIGSIDDITLKFRRTTAVFNRRSNKAIGECKIYLRGIKRVYGIFTLKYIYPLSRLAFRLMPVKIVEMIYGSKLRKKLLG